MLRYSLIAIGFISLFLGVIGIFVPLLPTTPFLLLTSFLFYKSSPRLQQWLLKNPYLGKYISDFQIHKSISKKVKIFSLSLL